VTDADCFRPLGKDRTPRYRIGQKVRCQIHRESAQALVHHWGGGQGAVTRWRQALGVGRTEGTFRLQHEHAWSRLLQRDRQRPPR
jgi:hypothetical protein